MSFLKKLWCCASGEVKHEDLVSNELLRVKKLIINLAFGALTLRKSDGLTPNVSLKSFHGGNVPSPNSLNVDNSVGRKRTHALLEKCGCLS